jgi:predicted dienelactone hydrolase
MTAQPGMAADPRRGPDNANRTGAAVDAGTIPAMRIALCLLLAAALAAVERVVEVDPLWFYDEARQRSIGCKLYRPVELPGRCPVIVFSHGLGGSQWTYQYLGRYWAERGFVSIHPSHPGSDYRVPGSAATPWGKLDALRTAAADPAQVAARIADLSAIIDHLEWFAGQVPELAGHLDLDRVGVAGHSLGADTALAAAGLAFQLPGMAQPAPPQRKPRAVLAMSPQGTGPWLAATAWQGVAVPVLLLTGTADANPDQLDGRELPWTWRLEAWNGLPAGGKLLAVLEGAHHFTFSNGAGGRGRAVDPVHHRAIQALTEQWWRSQLVGDPPPGLEIAKARSLLPAGTRVEAK